MPPLVDTGLNDLPKFGGLKPFQPHPPLATALVHDIKKSKPHKYSPIREFKVLKTGSLLKSLFDGVLFLIYYFKNTF